MTKFDNSIFEEAKIETEQLLSLLKQGKDLFPKRIVPKALLKQGYTYYKGIVVPISSVSHKYLYDDYEYVFLDAYIALFQKLLAESSSVTNEFAFRALLEMGSEDSFIIFDKMVDKEDKKLFVLLSLLVDYSSIETSMKNLFKEWFNKLYKDHETFLKVKFVVKDLDIINELKKVIEEEPTNLDKYTIAIRKARQLCNKHKADMLNKYSQKKIMQLTDNYKRMKSGKSHMLHGNVFLILHRMNQQSSENHLFRVFAYLSISGIDMLSRLDIFLSNKNFSKNISNFIKGHEQFKKKLREAWEKSK